MFFSVGLFDWKKDRKFFTRFEEPVSPDKEFPTEDGVLFFLSFSFFSIFISMFYQHHDRSLFSLLLVVSLSV